NAERLAQDAAVDARSDVFEPVSHHQRRRAAGDLDALDAAAHAAARLLESLAVLSGDEPGELFEMLLEKLSELEKRTRSYDRRRVSPVGESFLRGGDRGVQVFAGRKGCLRDHLSPRWVVHVEKVSSARFDPTATDEVAQDLGRRSRPCSDGSDIGHGG